MIQDGIPRRAPNGSGAKLHGQGPRVWKLRHDGCARIPLDSDTRSAAAMPPRRYCSTEALQRRTEAGPCQLQRLVRPRGLMLQFCTSSRTDRSLSIQFRSTQADRQRAEPRETVVTLTQQPFFFGRGSQSCDRVFAADPIRRHLLCRSGEHVSRKCHWLANE